MEFLQIRKKAKYKLFCHLKKLQGRQYATVMGLKEINDRLESFDIISLLTFS